MSDLFFWLFVNFPVLQKEPWLGVMLKLMRPSLAQQIAMVIFLLAGVTFVVLVGYWLLDRLIDWARPAVNKWRTKRAPGVSEPPQTGRPDPGATNLKLVTCLGGGLMVLALLFPIATVDTGPLGVSKDFMGYESDLLISAGIGAGLFILGLAHRPAPGRMFSPLGAVAALVGMWLAVGMLPRVGAGRVPMPAGFQITLTTGPAALIAFVGSVIAVCGCALKPPPTEADNIDAH